MSNFKVKHCWCGHEVMNHSNAKYCYKHRHCLIWSCSDKLRSPLGLAHGNDFFKAFDNEFNLKPIEVF